MNRTRRLITTLGVVALLGGVTAIAFGAPQYARDKSDDKKIEKKVELGEKVPDFTLIDLNGREYTLSDYKGKHIILEWTNPECPYIKGVYATGVVEDTLKKAKEMFGDDVVYLAVNSSANKDKEDVIKGNKAFLKKHDVDVPVLIDYEGTVGKMYGAKHTPDMYVIDTDMKLRYMGGFTDDHRFQKGDDAMNYVINALTQLEKGETVAPDKARRWGCSVKYARN